MNIMFDLPENQGLETIALAAVTVIRQLKRRFGIAAPRVAVRTHAPWYVRWLLIAGGVTAAALAMAWYTYDTGRSLAGFQSGRAAAEQAKLSEEVAHLRDENDEMRSQLAAHRAADADRALDARRSGRPDEGADRRECLAQGRPGVLPDA